MEIYVIDQEGNVKERYSHIVFTDNISILDGILKFSYKEYQVPIEEQKRWEFWSNIIGDYVTPQEAPFLRGEIDLNKEKRVEIVR